MSEPNDERSITYDDMCHLLTWLGIGLFCVGLLQTIEAVTTLTDGRWVAGSIHVILAVGFYICWIRTEMRAAVYRRALRIMDEERA